MKGTISDTTLVDNTSDPTIPPIDISGEKGNFLTAGIYTSLFEKTLGTRGGVSDAFGQNGLTLTALPDNLIKLFSYPKTSEKNLAAIKFLDEWFAEPDDLGEDFWREFDKELEANRFRIP